MKPLDLLKGKKIKVKTNIGVVVELEIKCVEAKHNSVDLEAATKENDWWPKTRDWTTYVVTFVNGHSKVYSSLDEIDLV